MPQVCGTCLHSHPPVLGNEAVVAVADDDIKKLNQTAVPTLYTYTQQFFIFTLEIKSN